ncbi:hypothetical protein [Streptomyces poonensis]|uniref:Uncharacterized protein n=1 Tax=Streptomyces poonensis TaxID=68255 RepID=A0A918PEN0_9ACTN|nr:hypothetical protein [Streptomyces poonensis]GGZ04213.1 hypothetical protein GCM10010365_23930 [Streptomyces poonensis]GLJ89337.1 hypothetical protein GCM10017589_19370 [Streptomyces poonensis]
MTDPLITPLQSSPVWQLVRLRFGAPDDRALVFLADDGDDAMVPPRSGDYWGYPRPTAREVRQGTFSGAMWVSLTERRMSVDILRRPPKSPARYGIAWKVSNPVNVARNRITEEHARDLIVSHISRYATLPGDADPLRKPPPHLGTAEIAPPDSPQVIGDTGLTYWFLDPPAALRPTPGAGAGPVLPSGFGEAHREAYRFYREVVAGGPVGLAALWLLHQPEQARDVLDWTVTHRDLLSDPNSWEHTLAATLQSLTPEDRGFVGVNLARVLSDVGVPQGDEVLRRIGGTGTAGNGDEPYGNRL